MHSVCVCLRVPGTQSGYQTDLAVITQNFMIFQEIYEPNTPKQMVAYQSESVIYTTNPKTVLGESS